LVTGGGEKKAKGGHKPCGDKGAFGLQRQIKQNNPRLGPLRTLAKSLKSHCINAGKDWCGGTVKLGTSNRVTTYMSARLKNGGGETRPRRGGGGLTSFQRRPQSGVRPSFVTFTWGRDKRLDEKRIGLGRAAKRQRAN